MAEKVSKFDIKSLIKSKIFWGIVVAIVIAIIAITHFTASAKNPFEKTVQSVNVSTGNISKSISATGSLSNSGNTDVEIPSSIKIKKVLVSTGQNVKKDQKLATIDKSSASEALIDINEKIDSLKKAIDKLSSSDSNYSLKKTVYNNQLTSLNNLLTSVKKMYEDGYIYATGAGSVSNIEDSDSDSKLNTNTSNDDKQGSGDKKINFIASAKISSDSSSKNLRCAYVAGPPPSSKVKIINSININSSDLLVIKNGKVSGSIKETDEYTVSVDCSGASNLKEGADYTIVITLRAKDNYAFAAANKYNFVIPNAKSSVKLLGKENEAKNGLQITITKKIDKADNNFNNNSSANGNKNNFNKNDFNKNDNNKNGFDKKPNGEFNANKSGGFSKANGAPINNDNLDAAGSIDFANGEDKQAASVNTSSYSVDMSTPFTLASASDVTITVSVDELDINSVAKDQKAEVTIDAIEDGKYEGKVSKVASTSTNSNGGNAKYDVDITLAKDDNMKQGMSASVTIVVSESANCLTLPINAVTEEGDVSYVYTQGSDDGELSGKLEVETGLSDGSNVEIKSGLSEGDTVYYMRIEPKKDGKNGPEGFPGGGPPDGFPSGPGGGGFPGGKGGPPDGFPGGGR